MLDPLDALTPPPPWPQAETAVLEVTRDLIADGIPPAPLLLAYDGDHPIMTVLLRPFGGGELGDVLVEVLSLALPLGTDRVLLAVGGRAWSLDDPIPPVTDDVDLRASVLVIATAQPDGDGASLTTTLHPYSHDSGLESPYRPNDAPESPALAALRVLIASRRELALDGPDLRVAAQFARLLLLGHEVRLAPRAAAHLELATTV